MLTEGSWDGLLSGWLRNGLRSLRRHHALLEGLSGFFSPTPVNAGARSEARYSAAGAQVDGEQDPAAAEASGVGLAGMPAQLKFVSKALAGLSGDLGDDVGAEVAGSVLAAEVAVRQVRFALMALWMMLRQWLVENMSPMNTLVSERARLPQAWRSNVARCGR